MISRNIDESFKDLLKVDLSRVDPRKCQDCYALDYNPGLLRILCNEPMLCPAVNPDITDHEKRGYKLGERASSYMSLKKSIAQIPSDPNYS